MQEINLLQNKLKDKTNQWERNNRTVLMILSLVLIAELVAGGMFYMLAKSAADSKLALDKENADIKTKLDQMQGEMADAKGFQAQTQNISTLLQNHVVWNEILDSLASSTLKNSRYLSMNSDTSGSVHIEGTTTSYTDLGKVLLALQTNDKLQSVKLLSMAPSSDQLAGVSFSLEIQANPAIFLSKE
jgi:Tfp pilus assembly protein PilN